MRGKTGGEKRGEGEEGRKRSRGLSEAPGCLTRAPGGVAERPRNKSFSSSSPLSLLARNSCDSVGTAH